MQDDPEIPILLKCFEAARANIVTRLAARDNCILLYLGAAAVLITAAFAQNSKYDVLLAIPVLSFAVASFVFQHNLVMDRLYIYIWKRIDKRLQELKSTVIFWEVSPEYKDHWQYSTGLRVLGEGVVIVAPAIFALVSYSRSDLADKDRILFGLAIVATTLAVGVMAASVIFALRNHAKLGPARSEANL